MQSSFSWTVSALRRPKFHEYTDTLATLGARQTQFLAQENHKHPHSNAGLNSELNGYRNSVKVEPKDINWDHGFQFLGSTP